MPRKTAEERKARDEAFEAWMVSLNPNLALRREMKLARLQAGLSQRELARRIGTAPSVIAHIESGKSQPKIKTLRRIAEITGTRLVIRLEARNNPLESK